jgi:hypothetical protein
MTDRLAELARLPPQRMLIMQQVLF